MFRFLIYVQYKNVIVLTGKIRKLTFTQSQSTNFSTFKTPKCQPTNIFVNKWKSRRLYVVLGIMPIDKL